MKTLNNVKITLFTLLLILSTSATAKVHVLDFDSDSQGNSILEGRIIDNEYANLHADGFGVSISSCNYNRSFASSKKKIGRCDVGRRFENSQITFNTLNKRGVTPEFDSDLQFGDDDGDGIFRNRVSGQAYDTTGLPPEFASRTNPGNILILNEYAPTSGNTRIVDGEKLFKSNRINDEGSRPAGFFEFTFTQAVDLKSIDFFDIEDKKKGLDAAFFAIQFFDEDGDEISRTRIPTLEDGQWVRQQYENVIGIFGIRINLPGSGGIDNLAFKKSVPNAPSEVSAPAVFSLLLLSGIYTVRRKRRN
jgi:hypothetical protein